MFRYTCLWADWSWQQCIHVLAYRRHAPVQLFYSELTSFAGVWGAAGPPSGEREGRSPLAIAKQQSTQREAASIICRGFGAGSAGYLWVTGSATGTLWVLSPLACATAQAARVSSGSARAASASIRRAKCQAAGRRNSPATCASATSHAALRSPAAIAARLPAAATAIARARRRRGWAQRE
jgi:hypothetical protein